MDYPSLPGFFPFPLDLPRAQCQNDKLWVVSAGMRRIRRNLNEISTTTKQNILILNMKSENVPEEGRLAEA